ncbi:hypothetical protein phytr_11900 [Candidatus Phycorickettsia trachydisci]|uniref:Uncharacterized protein n=1 Tax=Candidatus Phycorickettsia trachydisci TaxID=2115978 RepID=A0A2P1PA41_9RICK|nr:hypothetical protein [Candidatus Phycorickettsia trachydisci]AVP88115.1 hypothetical protein phytr_11900 [Candidatus Phycorickettsia trachydisci]
MLKSSFNAEENYQGTLPLDLDSPTLSLEHQKDPDIELPIIKVCEDGTLTTKIRLPNEKEVYLGLERIENREESNKWIVYTRASGRIGAYLSDVAEDLGCFSEQYHRKLLGNYGISTEEIEVSVNKIRAKFLNNHIFQKDSGFNDQDFKPGFQESIGLEGEKLDDFVNRFKNALKKRPKIHEILLNTRGGAVGFDSNWITYASNLPITGKLQTKSDPLPYGTFKLLAEDFGNVIISVGTAEYPNLPVYQNRGIFKNPYWVIQNEYDQLSMVLHSFTGKIAQEFWKDKIYMTVAPLPGMQKIILKSLKEGQLFIGDNKHKPYSDFPPLAHEYNRVFKIAKEGLDTSEFLDSELPDELTQFSQILDYTSPSPRLKPNMEGTGGDSGTEYINYIKVSALADIFEKISKTTP